MIRIGDLSSEDFHVYATLAAAAAGVTTENTNTKRVVAGIRCETDGTLVVKKTAGAVTVALPFKAGETQAVRVHEIVEAGSSGCVPVTVYR